MFHQPKTLDQALQMRAELGPDTTVINGGTDVVVAMNHGAFKPTGFLDISAIDQLRQINRENGHLIIGAGATFAQLGKQPIRALSQASLSVGGPAIRNRGTIGGNLVTASPAADGATALLALGAEVEMTSTARGPRWLPLTEFFIDYKKIALADDELVTRIRIPAEPRSRWYKIGKRSAVNISVVCCAIARRPDNKYGIALGSVAAMPISIPKAENLLDGRPLTEELINQVAATVESEVKPIDDHRASAQYRQAMCKTLTHRLLTDMANCKCEGDSHGH